MFGLKIIKKQEIIDLQFQLNMLRTLVDTDKKTIAELENTIAGLQSQITSLQSKTDDQKAVLLTDVASTPLTVEKKTRKVVRKTGDSTKKVVRKTEKK